MAKMGRPKIDKPKQKSIGIDVGRRKRKVIAVCFGT